MNNRSGSTPPFSCSLKRFLSFVFRVEDVCERSLGRIGFLLARLGVRERVRERERRERARERDTENTNTWHVCCSSLFPSLPLLCSLPPSPTAHLPFLSHLSLSLCLSLSSLSFPHFPSLSLCLPLSLSLQTLRFSDFDVSWKSKRDDADMVPGESIQSQTA